MFGFALQNVQPPSETAYGKSDLNSWQKIASFTSAPRRTPGVESRVGFFFFCTRATYRKGGNPRSQKPITVVVYDSARCSCSMYLQSPSSGMSTKAKNESKTKYT